MSALWQAIQAQRRDHQPSRPREVRCRVCGKPVTRKRSEIERNDYNACTRRCAALGRSPQGGEE